MEGGEGVRGLLISQLYFLMLQNKVLNRKTEISQGQRSPCPKVQQLWVIGALSMWDESALFDGLGVGCPKQCTASWIIMAILQQCKIGKGTWPESCTWNVISIKTTSNWQLYLSNDWYLLHDGRRLLYSRHAFFSSRLNEEMFLCGANIQSN